MTRGLGYRFGGRSLTGAVRLARQPYRSSGGGPLTARISRLWRALALVGRRGTVADARISATFAAMAAVLVFPGAASADVLSLSEARARVLRHAQATVDHPRTPFVYGFVTCSGTANHEKACTVTYDTATTRAEEARRQAAWVCPVPPRTPCGPRRPRRLAPWACTERMTAYYNPYTRTFPHPLPAPGEGIGDLGYIWLRYNTTPCGPLRYSSPRP